MFKYSDWSVGAVFEWEANVFIAIVVIIWFDSSRDATHHWEDMGRRKALAIPVHHVSYQYWTKTETC